jgi:hypothetical protein
MTESIMQRMTRRTSSFALKGLVAGLGALALGTSVQAADWQVKGQFGWFGVGKAYEVEKGHYYWVGEFSGTFFNDKGAGNTFHLSGVKCPAFFDADFNKGKSSAGGYCIVSDPDGDQAYLTWNNAGNIKAHTGTFEWTGGTGKYKGISGGNTFTSGTQINWADGTSSGFAIWNR